VFTFAAAPVLGLVALAATARVERLSLLPWAALAMVLWQAQETTRRALIARLRHRDAIPGDAVSFLGQAACVYLLWRAGRISPEWAMAATAVTSGVAAVIQLAQILLTGGSGDREGAAAEMPSPPLAAEAMAWWRTGRWLLVTGFVNVGTVYLTPWVLEAAGGGADVARLTALNWLLNLTNPVLFSMAGLVVAAAAGAKARAATPLAGVRAARAIAVRYAAAGMLLVLPYYVLVLAAPRFVLVLFYRETSPYVGLAGEVPWVVGIYASLYAATMAVSLLNGMGEARGSFVATLTSSAATVALVVPLVFAFGLHGALVGGAVPMLAQFGVAVWMIRRLERRAGAGVA
jgi:O-antigen/teichoic acid export membrane protein